MAKQVNVICSGSSKCRNWPSDLCEHRSSHIRGEQCYSYKMFDSDRKPVWRHCVRVHRFVRCVKVKGV